MDSSTTRKPGLSSGVPDYIRLFKRNGFILAGVCFAFALAGAICAILGASQAVFGKAAAGIVVIGFGAVFWNAASWYRRERQGSGRLAPESDTVLQSPGSSETSKRILRALGRIGVGILLCGLPSAIIGELAHVRALVIGGLALLAGQLFVLAIWLPTRRARRHPNGRQGLPDPTDQRTG